MKAKTNRKTLGIMALYIVINWIRLMPKPSELSEVICLQYLLTYKMGGIPRGLIGTLFGNLYFTENIFFLLFSMLTMMMVVIYLGFAKWVLNNNSDSYVHFYLIIMTVIPTSIISFTVGSNYGRLDIFLIMILLIAVTLLGTGKCLWLVPILVCCGMFVHSIFGFLYYVGIFDVTLFMYWRTKKKRYLILTVINTVIVGLLMLYFNVGHPIMFMSMDDVKQSIASRTNMDLSEEYYWLDLWMNSSPGSILRQSDQSNVFLQWETLFYLIAMTPVFVPIIRFWKKLWIKYNKPVIFLIIWLSVLAVMPCYILLPDYGRWTVSICLNQFVLLLCILKLNDIEINRIMGDIYNGYTTFDKVAVILYLVSFGTCYDVTVCQVIHRIISLIT